MLVLIESISGLLWIKRILRTSSSCLVLVAFLSARVSYACSVEFSCNGLLTPASDSSLLLTIVDDELVKVVRVGVIARRLEENDMEAGDFEDLSILNEEFTSQILSGVRFAPLVMSSVNTIIPSYVWSPSIQRGYPSEFKRASMHLLMCSNSQLVQPVTIPSIDERMNMSAMLPRTIWLEILSYTHRKCEPSRIHSFAH